MELKLENYEESFGSELHCPSCGSQYLHHDVIDVFERTEDSDTGLHVTIGDGTIRTDTNLENNPSKRRHGLKIQFYCELCKSKPTLILIQHKGNTYLNMLK